MTREQHDLIQLFKKRVSQYEESFRFNFYEVRDYKRANYWLEKIEFAEHNIRRVSAGLPPVVRTVRK